MRIKPATDSTDIEILYPIPHPAILWCRARAKSLWMGFNLSFFSLSLGEVMKRDRGVTAVGGAGERQEARLQHISGFWLSSWGHCCDILNESLYICVCLTTSSHLSQ